MATNIVVGMTALTGLSHGLFCAFYDFEGLWPQIATYVVGVSLAFATRPVIRFDPLIAAYWYAIALSFILFFLAFLTGRDAGIHWYLLSGPALSLSLIGAQRWKGCLALSAMMLALIVLVEISFQAPAPFMRFDETLEHGFMVVSVMGTLAFTFIPTFDALYRAGKAEALLAVEHARSESLLENLLPKAISDRLKDQPDQIIADDVGGMSVLFADIVGFTPRAASRPASEVVSMLNRVFSEFDDLSEERGLEKIKTVGDAYMVASGVPEPRTEHAAAIADLALAMQEKTRTLSHELGETIEIRAGAHTGPAVAGVIGNRKFFYDVWGDTVNTAARMESHGEPNRIQITREMKEAIGDGFLVEKRGDIEIKGKGLTETWWLLGRS